jgi:hypothetical protein
MLVPLAQRLPVDQGVRPSTYTWSVIGRLKLVPPRSRSPMLTMLAFPGSPFFRILRWVKG